MYNEAGFCVCGKPREVFDGDGDGYYEIRNAGDLVSFANKVNAGETEINGALLNSVDLSGYPLVPIGTAAHPFAGNFDGRFLPLPASTVKRQATISAFSAWWTAARSKT